jgi:hypothetical protein
MFMMIFAAIFLGSFALLFTVWLVVWSWVMSPMQLRVSKRPDYTIQEILS